MKKLFKIILPFLLLVVIVSPFSAFASSPYYTNISGQKVHLPTYSQTAPVGSTALCRDGSYSFSAHRRGTCSHHRGVSKWLY